MLAHAEGLDVTWSWEISTKKHQLNSHFPAPALCLALCGDLRFDQRAERVFV
jgi:hypothetical protein